MHCAGTDVEAGHERRRSMTAVLKVHAEQAPGGAGSRVIPPRQRSNPRLLIHAPHRRTALGQFIDRTARGRFGLDVRVWTVKPHGVQVRADVSIPKDAANL
jgi:hypothetical protein